MSHASKVLLFCPSTVCELHHFIHKFEFKNWDIHPWHETKQKFIGVNKKVEIEIRIMGIELEVWDIRYRN